ncbi:hypothetical protein FCG67_17885 [Rhodococcus oryzae]|uniref:Uncharacterized protein n=1 Tax=Rhodococcus oryzae TaxID=2571143 RepID=A0ABY2RHD6_9NOCA|nr:hypothetical protein FCG67_17885 [Rhodococcus oryzae]
MTHQATSRARTAGGQTADSVTHSLGASMRCRAGVPRRPARRRRRRPRRPRRVVDRGISVPSLRAHG